MNAQPAAAYFEWEGEGYTDEEYYNAVHRARNDGVPFAGALRLARATVAQWHAAREAPPDYDDLPGGFITFAELHDKQPPPRPQRNTPHVAPTSRYGAAALARATARVRNTGEGSRNTNLFTEACGLFELANAGVLNPATVEAEFTDAALSTGLNPREVADVLKSARRRTEGQQRSVPARAPMEVRW